MKRKEFFEIVLGLDRVAVTAADGGGAGRGAQLVVGEFGGREERGEVAVALGAEEFQFLAIGGELHAAARAKLGHHLIVVLREVAEGGAFFGREKRERRVLDAADAEVVAKGRDQRGGQIAAGEEFLLARAGGGAISPPAAVAGTAGAGGRNLLLKPCEGAAERKVARVVALLGRGGGGERRGGLGNFPRRAGRGADGGGRRRGGAHGEDGDERDVGNEGGGEEQGDGFHAGR